MKLWIKILIALLLGVGTGFFMGPQAEIFKPIGQLFLNLILMVVPLLVLSSMAVGVTSIHDPSKLGRVGIKTLFFFVTTTVIAICFGILFAKAFNLGAGLNLSASTVPAAENTMTLKDMFLTMVPTNPIAALAEGNVLQIIVFAFFLGVAINFAGERGRPLKQLLESLADVMYRLTSIIMEFSPIGVFAIMAWVSGTFGIGILLPLLKFLTAYYLACFAHVIIVFVGVLHLVTRLNPIPFFKGMGDAIMIAFTTCSSSATLPASMHCVQENLGVSRNITRFILPLGSTINMNGSAIFQGMSALFVAQAFQIPLDWMQLITIVIIGTLSAIGAPGIPGSGLVMLSVVFASAGLPLEGIALLAGIDRLREMISTVLNILGDAVCAIWVAKTEDEFDENRYYHAELVEFEPTD